MGLCLLKHWFVELHSNNIVLNLRNLSLAIESFLRRMDLFNDFPGVRFIDRTSSNARRDMTGQLIELRSLHNVDEIGPAASQIASTIVHGLPDIDRSPDPHLMRPSDGERIEDTLEYVFSEILLNALDHGTKQGYRAAHANIAAQYYPNSRKLEVAILDNGCGLLETLRSHPQMEGDISDSKAITIARRPRVSCNRDAELGLDTRNQGIGLTVCSQIALAAGGKWGIFSGKSRHTVTASGEELQVEVPYWRGTGVFFEFDKAGLETVDKGAVIRAIPGFRTVPSINFG
jgi:hypothetical protein